MLSICTTVHRAHGRQLGSVQHAPILQPHLLGTWPSSREGMHGQVVPFYVLCWMVAVGVHACGCLAFEACCVLFGVFALQQLAVSRRSLQAVHV
jgi:hypothetical protein